ncbi:kinesin motor protein cin8 [Haplosporangium sp. Z 27]|nr:kinesin motor protein cin8 [Haplosporangium sp. Z 27]
MSRIRSIKIRSDSTLSELLVTQLDGRCLLEGEFIRVRLQPDRVLRNGRYKFQIGFYTKDISGSNPFDHPLFMPILEIDPDFDPVGCRLNESPDVTFQFPCSNPSGIPTIIMAHSSVIKRSQYFAHRVAEVVEKKTREGIPFNGITCEITEFTSSVFRVMLQFLYLGRLRFKNISDKVEQESGYSASSPAMGELPRTRAYRSNPTGQEKHIWRSEKVYFGDLFRIAERYGIPALCTLSLRGMQCTLSMSIAIAMLTNLPCNFSSAPECLDEHKKDNEGCKNEGSMSNIQIKLARDIIKEYMRFIVEVTIPRQSFKEPVSREESLEILQHLGDCVLESIEQSTLSSSDCAPIYQREMFGARNGASRPPSALANHRTHPQQQQQPQQGTEDGNANNGIVRKKLSSESLSSNGSINISAPTRTITVSQHIQQNPSTPRANGHTSHQSNHQNNAPVANKELNIQVVVRIRTRSEREVRENSPVAVQAQNKEILVPSTLGDRAPSKSYSFDRVFMYSDQECIYNEIVTPILDEVLTGYNCTIFAYGQTGTGKTFTMEGDLRDSFGECSRDAGIIPRTLYTLFAALERKDTEYTVRVSFLELYNEEVKDLLVPDDDRRVVKIFDSIKKQGPLIQGLEEVSVFNATQGIEALRKGSAKRTVAATKSNDKSSRSHGVFSITVHVKETTDDGEELLKIGKLNLVDLAGSENIARSGAEATQAKEAGRINQSLLTLGRVINSLVERSQHIPYRESKLTRLLEDSLGGKTKTCIIATISPARSCLEETISTLNYANRAKNIKNTPEINQKMSKKTLIKEYLLEIDRLKADLNATREKNGVFMTHESYQALLDENSSNKDLVGEIQKQVDKALQEQARVEEKFRENMKILTATEYKLSISNAELDKKRAELQETQDELTQTKQILQEEKILCQAHARAEDQLNSVAAGLRSTLATSVKDIKGLHEKLERKSEIERVNRHALTEFQERALSLVGELRERIKSFDANQGQLLTMATQKIDQAFQEAMVSADSAQKYLKSQLERMDKSLETFNSLDSNTLEKAQVFKHEFENLRQEMAEFLKSRVEASKSNALEGFEELKRALSEFSGSIEKHQTTMAEKVFGLVDESTRFSKDSISRHQLAIESYDKATQSEVKFLAEQNRVLRQRLKEHETKKEEQKSLLLTEIGGLLDNFMRSQTSALMGHFSTSCEALESSTARLNTAHSKQKAWTSEFELLGSQRIQELVELRGTFENDTKNAISRTKQDEETLTRKTDTFGSRIVDDLQSQQEFMETRMFEMNAKAMTGYEQMQAQHLAMTNLFSQTSDHTITALQDLRIRTNNANTSVESAYQQTSDDINTAKHQVQLLIDDAGQNLDQTREEVEELIPQRLKIDDSTGRTPARKKYKYPQTWERARPSQDLLNEFRALGRVNMLTMNQPTNSHDFSDSDDYPEESSVINQAPEVLGLQLPSSETESHLTQDVKELATDVSSPFYSEAKIEPTNQTIAESLPKSPSRRLSQLFTEQDAEKENSMEVAQSTSNILRPIKLARAGLSSAIASDFGPSKKTGAGSSIHAKRSASEMDGGNDTSEINNTMADISNNVHTTSALSNTFQQKINGASLLSTGARALMEVTSTSTSSLVPPSSGPFSGTGLFGTGKSGLINSSEGPRKISRPAPIKPTKRPLPFGKS